MRRTIVRFGPALMAILLTAPVFGAEDPEKVKASVASAINYLKMNAMTQHNTGAGGAPSPVGAPGPGGLGGGLAGNFGPQEGAAVLAGVALLEAGVPADDPTIQSIAKLARGAGISQMRTYPICLDIIFLDKLGEQIDTILIQSMGARLVAGQNARGGWTYGVPGADEQEQNRLRRALSGAVLKGTKDPRTVGSDVNSRPPLDPAVEEIIKQKRFARNDLMNGDTDDNSNTQFALIALWSARRHGVPVENALKRVEARFRTTHIGGGWPYMNAPPLVPTPSMTCVGLLGLAVASGMNGERRMKGVAIDPDGKLKVRGSDKSRVAGTNPLADPLVQNGLKFLERTLAAYRGGPPQNNGPMGAGAGFAGPMGGGGFGVGRPGGNADIRDDLYFMWCLERVCMVFDIGQTLGKIDWHQWGSSYLMGTQQGNGSWMSHGQHVGGPVADTAFGLMFMCRSNIIRDLNKVLKATADLDKLPKASEDKPGDKPKEVAGNNPMPTVPTAAPSKAVTMAKALVQAKGAERTKLIKEYTEEKGVDYSQALLQAIPQLTGEDQKATRYALAERMGRMTADTLRKYMSDDNPELRSAACWGAANSDESKSLIADLIKALEDDEDIVWAKARLSLKHISGKNFGPKDGDSPAKRKEAAALWLAWWKTQPAK